MKKLFITLNLIICSLISVMARDSQTQELEDTQINKQQRIRDKSVYVEFFGPSSMIGLSYDARFKGNNHFGYRTGLGYTYGLTEIGSFYNHKSHSFVIPLELNTLVGGGNSRLELGLGTGLGLYYTHWYILGEKDSACTFGYFCYGNIGYRLTTKKGFQFRIGIMPTFNFGGKHAVEHDPKLFHYLSFGYAF